MLLAVMDADMDEIDPETWDPIGRFEPLGGVHPDTDGAPERSRAEELGWGFGLATLDFAVTAGRNPVLVDALGERTGRLVAAFEPTAERRRTDDEPLSVEQLASILVAFDQGVALLALAGGQGSIRT